MKFRLRTLESFNSLSTGAVGPSPPGYEVWLVEVKDLGQLLHAAVGLGRGCSAYLLRIRGHPSKVKRGKGSEQVGAPDAAQAVGEGEIIDDAGPQLVGHAEVSGAEGGEPLQLEEGHGGQYEPPDLFQIAGAEEEGVDEGLGVEGLGIDGFRIGVERIRGTAEGRGLR